MPPTRLIDHTLALALFFTALGYGPAVARAQLPAGDRLDQVLIQRDAALARWETVYVEGNWRQALAERRTAIALERQALGELHGDVFDSREQIASLALFEEGLAAARTESQVWRAAAERLPEGARWRLVDARLFQELLEKLDRVPAAELTKLLADDKTLTLDYLAGRHEAVVRGSEALIERWRRWIGAESAMVANSLEVLAASQRELGASDKLPPLHEQILAIRKKVLGPAHPILAVTLADLAQLRQESGDWPAAADLWTQVVALRRQTLGEDHLAHAESLNALAIAHDEAEQFDLAEATYAQAIARYAAIQGAEHADTAQVMANLADCLQNQAKLSAALDLLKKVLAIRRKALEKDSLDTADTLQRIGLIELELKHNAEAAAALAEAIPAYNREFGEKSPEAAEVAHNLGRALWRAGKLNEAIPAYLQVLAAREPMPGDEIGPFASLVYDVGVLHQRTERPTEAIPYLRRARDLYQQLVGVEHADYALVITTLAQAYRARGDYASAQPLARQALAIRTALWGKDHPETVSARRELAICHHGLHDHAEAERLFRQAIADRENSALADDAELLTDLSNLGLLLVQSDRPVEGEKYLRRALAIGERVHGPDSDHVAVIVDNLSLACSSSRPEESLRLTERSVALRRKRYGEQHPEYAHGLNNLAYNKQTRGELDEARALFQQAGEIVGRTLGTQHPDHAVMQSNLAAVLILLGREAEATTILAGSVAATRQTIERSLPVLSERQQLAMTRKLRGPLDGLLSVAAGGEREAAAYEAVLAWKGAVFSRQRWARVAARNPAAAPALKQLQVASNRLATLALEGGANQPQLQSLTQEKERLERELQSALAPADLAELQGKLVLTVAALQKQLPAEGALVDFFEYEHYAKPVAGDPPGRLKQSRRMLAFVVTPSRPLVRVELGDVEPIAAAIAEWRELFGLARDAADGNSPPARLRKLVWEPLAPSLAESKLVLVSPDGPLGRLPLGALPGKTPGTYLLEELTIAIIPVPQQLPGVLGRPKVEARPDSPSLLLIGDVDYGGQPGAEQGGTERATIPTAGGLRWQFGPLAGSFAEIAAIERRFRRQFRGGDVLTLDRELATEAAFRDEAGTHRWLHIATHGFFAPPRLKSALEAGSADPSRGSSDGGLAGYHPGLLSGLALAGANSPAREGQDDGILTALEVAALDLAGIDLAVLSACETGLGEVAGGEGVLGLQRAFQVAGAKTTITSLWKVPDLATSQLMQRFYDNLWEKKLSKVEALREAQLWMLREGVTRGLIEVPAGEQKKTLPPFFWGAFVLGGDWR
ncbi:MAG: CHAT domain-containing tetratricopeptide repeat protein [Pirellulaceae bacterium]|nr:CHAT domain-containing tetratricopeptide repeat protein [Pirellulaceae bacterium]